MIRYAHTNLIVKDLLSMISFYVEILGCRPIGETRDLRGDWVDRLTGIPNAHIFGEHLALPGDAENGPTLELFSYDTVIPYTPGAVNASGFTHIAFAVDDVEQTLAAVLARGGTTIGEVVHAEYADGRKATFVYATDPEGNILELQSWK